MIYLASPYSHPSCHVRRHRFEEACRATAALLRAGVVVFSPIVHSHCLATYGLPTRWDYWQRLDREYLAMCDVVAVLTLRGWRESEGVGAEIELAREFGLPVVYVAPDELDDADTPPTFEELFAHRRGPTRP